MTIQPISRVKPLSSEDLEPLLRSLPEPNSVVMGLFGGNPIDYENFSRLRSYRGKPSQLLGKSAEPLDEVGYPNLLWYLEGCTKKDIIEIAKAEEQSEYQLEELLRRIRNEHWEGVHPQLLKAEWVFENGKLELSMRHIVSISYSGDEPPYVTQIRQRLAHIPMKTSRHTEIEIAYR